MGRIIKPLKSRGLCEPPSSFERYAHLDTKSCAGQGKPLSMSFRSHAKYWMACSGRHAKSCGLQASRPAA
eukprot:14630768-Alexandrium_andersonii.AAC.1